MYKYLILFLFIGSLAIGSHYVKEAGVETVFSLSPSDAEFEPLAVDDVIGKYLCDSTTGCKESYEITLYQNGAAKLSRIENGIEPEIIERGTWKFIAGGIIALSIEQKDEEGKDDIIYDTPRVLTIQSVSTSSLAKIIYDAKAYPLISKPKFLKQDLIPNYN